MKEKRDLEIRSRLTDEMVPVELNYSVPQNLISTLHRAFQKLKLKGVVMAPTQNQELLTKAECQDYADDYVYDEQQCRAYFSTHRWEDFNLKDAAFFISYLHIFPKEARYSAMPFVFELVLEANKWVDAFSSLIARLRDDARNEELLNMLTPETIQAIIGFLETLRNKAEGFEQYEDVTVIDRTIKLWKSKLE